MSLRIPTAYYSRLRSRHGDACKTITLSTEFRNYDNLKFVSPP